MIVWNSSTMDYLQVWRQDADFFGGEGALWNRLTVQLRDTTLRITMISIDENTATLDIHADPNATYLVRHSPDLVSFTDLTSVTTGSDGTSTITLDATEKSGFYLLKKTP